MKLRKIHLTGMIFLVISLFLVNSAGASSPGELIPVVRIPTLNETCTGSILNQNVQINPDGTFVLPNLPVPVGQFRLRIFCERFGFIEEAQSQFLTATANQALDIGPITFGEDAPAPESLTVSSSATILDATTPTGQITVLGNFPGGVQVDMTASTTGTSYTSTNPAFATVSPEGLVTAVASGAVLISARNEGAVATIPIQVVLGDDTDGDGLPDDFEIANSINPGGANVSLLNGTIASAHGEVSGAEAANAIDGSRTTSWYANTGDAANLGGQPIIEVTLFADGNISQVRLLGNAAAGSDFIAGVVQGFDALGNQMFNSGEVFLPEPSRDLSVPVDVDGIRSIRFTSTRDESGQPPTPL